MFTQCYDSSIQGSEDQGFMYEKLFRVYQRLSGDKLKSSLSIVDFLNLLNDLPETISADNIQAEALIKRLGLKNQNEISLPDLFNAIKYIAEDSNEEFVTLLNHLSNFN